MIVIIAGVQAGGTTPVRVPTPLELYWVALGDAARPPRFHMKRRRGGRHRQEAVSLRVSGTWMSERAT